MYSLTRHLACTLGLTLGLACGQLQAEGWPAAILVPMDRLEAVQAELKAGAEGMERLKSSGSAEEREIAAAAAIFLDSSVQGTNADYISAAHKLADVAPPAFWVAVVTGSPHEQAIGAAGTYLMERSAKELRTLLPELLAAYESSILGKEIHKPDQAEMERWVWLFKAIAKASDHTVPENTSRHGRLVLQDELLAKAREVIRADAAK